MPQAMDQAQHRASVAARSRLENWRFPGLARVIHQDHGTVVVPCKSKLAAIQCAAEVWGVGWATLGKAEVWRAEPGDKPAPMPKII